MNPIRHDMSTGFDEPENIAELKEWFDAIWHDRQCIQDAIINLWEKTNGK